MPAATAPYNFVPLPDRVMSGSPPPPRDTYDAACFTGWFDVSYRTLTPTYTRGAKGGRNFPGPLLGREDNNGQGADFFHRGDDARTPVLPGSALRGMVRGLFEVMTYSRMEFVSDHRLFFRYMAAPAHTGLGNYYRQQFQTQRLIAGVLQQNAAGERSLRVCSKSPKGFVALSVHDPFLDPALRYAPGPKPLKPMRPVYQVRPVSVCFTGQQAKLLRNEQQFALPLCTLCPPGTPGAHQGFLIVPGTDVGYRHHYQVILDPDGDPAAMDYPVPRDVYADYENWGRMAHGSNFERNTGAAPRLLAVGSPAFALKENTTPGGSATVIGAALMLTLRYEHAISDVAADGRTVPPDCDMTQSVFGRIGPNAEAAIKTRVFFEDAVYRRTTNQPDASPWLSADPATSTRVPDILSGPKPTAVQMYLEQEPGQPLKHYNTPQARLRGFKRYWHRSPEAAEEALQADDQPLTTQETRIRPVRAGVRFTGRVRFENLSATELGALYAGLHLPDGCAHRFGMGKSLGLGSLRVTVPRVTLLRMADRYQSLVPGAGEYSQDEADTIIEKAYARFVRRVNQHETECGVPAPRGPSLWNSPRLKSLAALLLFDSRPPDRRTETIGVDDGPASEQWKQRDVLPEARQLVSDADVRAVADVIEVPPA